jgi:hypothetical protein|tara:strand:+ start:1968 stop:2681 length:714 start_codon:yes stop_codon:yes gene_type:complete
MRNYRKEYDNYHSRPEQKIRRAARNAARKLFADAAPDKDVHHKDNNPLNNDKKNLSLVTQHYNRKEPRLREKKLKLRTEDAAAAADLKAKQAAEADALKSKQEGEIEGLKSKHEREGERQKKQDDAEAESEKARDAREEVKTEDMGTVTGPHIAGTGDDSSTVKVRKKKKVYKRDEGYKDNLPSDWEKRSKLSRKVRKDFWKSWSKKKGRKEEKEDKKKTSTKKRVIDNVLAIQQKV